MKTTTSTIVNKVIAETKKLTSSPIERKMIEELLKYGSVRTAHQKGFSIDDRTSKIVSICIKLGLSVNDGNDAPKGGKIGNYIEGNNDKRINKIVSVFKRKAAIEKAKEQRKSLEAANRRNEQITSLIEYFKENPEFKAKIKYRIEHFSSTQWRNWVRMKVAAALVGNFGKFELTAVDIRDAVYHD